MVESRAAGVLDWEGPLSPPRKNGELVFDALWESRVFGVTMTLYEAGRFAWPEFRDRLIAEIAAFDQDHDGFHYWECWLQALERLVVEKGLCASAALSARLEELAARPAGHDHSGR